jgi:hypothetical protein
MGNLNIPSKPRMLSFKEKGLLVDKLVDCPQMKDRHSRNTMVQELRFASSISRPEVDRNDVRNIVETSLNYEGGLQELVVVIADYEKDVDGRDSLPMQRLSSFLEVLFSSPEPITINVDLLIELYQLTDNVHVTENDLYDIYRESRPTGWSSHQFQSSEEGGVLSLMIRDLAQIGLQNSQTSNKLTHPLLTFVKLLSRHVPAPVSNQLILWREKSAEKENITLEEEHIPALPAEEPSEASFYLLVRFKPDLYNFTKPANEPENFDVQAVSTQIKMVPNEPF